MIKCNQCGKVSAAGAVNCQLCGAPLSSMVDGGMSPRPTSLEQPELPAWLESLRAGERSASPVHTAANFPAADFVDENSLPSWMRAERNEARDNTGANPPVSVRPSSSPGPITEGERPLPTGIAARSLLDEHALPSWMREIQQSGPVSAQEKIAASSLVQPDNMPDWMKALQRDKVSLTGDTGGSIVPPASTSSRAFPSAPQMPVTPQQPSGGGSSSGSQSQLSPVAPSALAGQSGFSARNLVDPQALPSWIVQQDEGFKQSAQSPQVAQPETLSNPRPSVQGPTFPASSLLDVNALPAWLREGGQGGQTQRQASPLANQPFQVPSTSPGVSAPAGRMPASSFSAPEWMLQADLQQLQTGSQYEPVTPPVPGMPQANVPVGPPKVENIRVPNRPRNEVNPNENSEVAANVFSSMLGVASAAPNYPVSSPRSQSSLGGPAQSNMGYPMGQPGMQPSPAAMNYAGTPMGAVPNTPGISHNAPQGYASGNSYGGAYQGGMSNPQMGNPSSAITPYGSNAGITAPGQKALDAVNEQKNAKKRGLFGAILEWLTREAK